MVETDWREILSFSQRELKQTDKEKLCESLSWMEADDIELNFTDLKSLFRLAQDILKFKTEQVNNLLGQLETMQMKGVKSKVKSSRNESPTVSDSPLSTLNHQEDQIKANKEILDQLHADIAELKDHKNNLEDKEYLDRDSESSRDTLSEINAVMQLENEITMKNKHIRKLLVDVKGIEEENAKLKEKVTVLKDKLTEATRLIDNLTEQLLAINNECTQLKVILGKAEQERSHFSIQIETLKKEISGKESKKDNLMREEIKSKVQHWKNIARSKKAEAEALSHENSKLKEDLALGLTFYSPKKDTGEEAELKIKELQDKLLEASNEINHSAKLIKALRAENKQLKSIIDETPDFSVSDIKNESDDGKERTIINKLKKKVRTLTGCLREAEEMIVVREKEFTEMTCQLQLLQTDEGINALIEGLKNKKRELKVKDEGIKSLIKDVNDLSQHVDDLQLENETLRQRFNIPCNEKISTKETLQKYRDMEQNNLDMNKELRNMENKLICLELNNRSMKTKLANMTKKLNKLGYSNVIIEDIDQNRETNETMPMDGGGESSVYSDKQARKDSSEENDNYVKELQAIYEENEGLRKGLQEILDFLKDNSTTSSGVLALQCPSLEKVLTSMEARHTAGWFSPHMTTVMELRTALGSKDALLTALHDARKEIFEVITQLSNEAKKSSELERKLNAIEYQDEQKAKVMSKTEDSNFEFGTWISDEEQNSIDFYDKTQIENAISKGNYLYEEQLKKGLEYFHNKFQTLYEKMTTMTIEAGDELNKWTLKEEQYIAQIENLKAQLLQKDDEDISDHSPGIIPNPSNTFLERKCSYIEESYKYIRTLNENLKNENLESKRDAMLTVANYEAQVQKLILTIANLTDKLRNSISKDLFWKQNFALNDVILKYRRLIERGLYNENKSIDLEKCLDRDRVEIINRIQKQFDLDANVSHCNTTDRNNVLAQVEQAILQKQLQQICNELDNSNKTIELLETTNFNLQELQSKEIDKTLAAITNEEVDLMRNQLQKLFDDNKILKEQNKHVGNKLDIALVQLQHKQQRQISNDMEINMLRHQILDLQSSGDGKAIIARLSSEVLVAHLQASENHKQVERLTLALNKEMAQRVEAEEMLGTRQKIFDVYTLRYESKFRYMYELIQCLREQYQGGLPLVSIESYMDKFENISRKTRVANEQLSEIEDLQSSLMTKHSVFDQILDISKGKCMTEEDACPHQLKNVVLQSTQTHELDYMNKKLKTLEQAHEDLIKHCNNLEKMLVLNSQAFVKPASNGIDDKRQPNNSHDCKLELEDVQSDDETNTRRSQTVTLPSPKLLKPKQKLDNDMLQISKENTDSKLSSPVRNQPNKIIPELINKVSQTCFEVQKCHKSTQKNEDLTVNELKINIDTLKKENNQINTKFNDVMSLAQQRSEEVLVLNKEKISLESKIQHLNYLNNHKDELNGKLRSMTEELRGQIDSLKTLHVTERSKVRDSVNNDNKSLLLSLQQMENDKNNIIAEFKELLNSERDEYSKTAKELQVKIMELQSKLDRRGSDSSGTNDETLKEVITKYTMKITELEDKCFRLQSELDECKAERATYQSEADRWRELASERLNKMEQLNSQLEERHCHEVESYKAENQHWLSQLHETQKEHMDLRSRLSDQKALYIKQLGDKDAHIEQLRNVVHNLKTQVMNMQTMLSVNDPSFDLSAIVEVDETSDALSQLGSDRLELKFESTVDFNELQDDMRVPSSSNLWQETIIERLRREKQLASKQNGILRRQIKALAARERRSRLDAQNLKNQVFRISTSGSKAATAETVALHNKIASLQAQLTSARRDTQSNVALWDKWKRSQQAAERWQVRYEEKCQEVNKMEASLNLAKSALTRLEKEKRVLLSRLSEFKSEHRLSIEKQDDEPLEKSHRSITDTNTSFTHDVSSIPISSHALLDRVQAQQHRIAALEIAEKGNEYLVSEYEKSLATITSLKGQVLKLESTLLEAQIRTPIKTNNDTQPEIDYWKSYCEMLKEENVQLTLKVNSLETTSSTPHQHKVNDLEQTVLTLRGLVSKLQAEQKTSSLHKKVDSKPSSGRSTTEKSRTQTESHRLEIANLKRSIQDKDLLLERSKEMLKIAAEREDELLRENTLLRRRIDDLIRPKEGFLSA